MKVWEQRNCYGNWEASVAVVWFMMKRQKSRRKWWWWKLRGKDLVLKDHNNIVYPI